MINAAEHLGIVGAVLRRVLDSHPWLEPFSEDLEAAGNLGLCEAANRFDESMGFEFSTFAWCVVHRAIARESLLYRTDTVQLDDALCDECLADEIEEAAIAKGVVSLALSRLKPAHRRLVATRHALSTVSTAHSVSDIAAAWGVEQRAVRRDLRSAQRRLRRAVKAGSTC